jgi:oxygen-independent coproporphyrinogen-3 oxidase
LFHVKHTGDLRPRFGLYVHWPFCASKCPYCDFNSHVATTVNVARWESAYRSEIVRLRQDTGPRVLDTIFFGGGTPSLMPPDLVGKVIAAARAAWTPSNTLEVTLEANPGSVEAARFAGFRDAGVNRVSIGLQALDDAALRRLGRVHSAAEGRRAVEIAQAVFPRVSIDLIYARQGQSLAEWARELDTALALGTSHLSLYQLTIEPGTVFAARHARGLLRGLPDDDLAAEMFDLTQDRCAAKGRPAYEVSNHAVPGEECGHNLIYWTGGDWAAVGPGGHGRLTIGGVRWATEALRAPEAWLEAVERSGSGELPRTAIVGAETTIETLLMGLRLTSGIPVETIPVEHRPPAAQIAALADAGLLDAREGRLRVTAAGRLVTNRIIAALCEHLD